MSVEFLDMGRNKEFEEQLRLTLPAGTKGRVLSVLRPGMNAMTYVRQALMDQLDRDEEIEAEVERRLAERLKKAASE